MKNLVTDTMRSRVARFVKFSEPFKWTAGSKIPEPFPAKPGEKYINADGTAISCKIRTPQFDGNGGVKEWKEQIGALDLKTAILTPLGYPLVKGGHAVQFWSWHDFNKARVW